MSSSDSPFSQQSITESPGDIRSLFDRCAEMQKKLAKSKPSILGDFFNRQAVFLEPLFPAAPNLGRIEILNWRGHLYEASVKLLKTAPNDEKFLYLLVQWMQSEGIRAPGGFFQLKGLRRLTKGVGFSGANIRNTYLVRGWLPYTEPLVRKWKWLWESGSKNPGDSLLAQGYDSAAVDLVCSPRNVARGSARPRWGSAVEFTCEWVASRSLNTSTKYERETLRNSYSRFFGKSRYRLSRCSFCDKAAEDEFWRYGSPVLHCGEHKADRLPISESTACTDRVGRRWWRDNLDVRYTAAPSVSS